MQSTHDSSSDALIDGRSDLHARLTDQVLEGPVQLKLLPMGARFNLRVSAAGMPAASKAFGVELPDTIGIVASDASRRALCLGPDEWVLHAEVKDMEAIVKAFENIYAATPHSLVDISEREIALSITGEQAATLLSVGCPIDLQKVAIGHGQRTVFDGASVVLHRDGETDYRLEVWRSFLPHVWDLLNTANRELATGL